jgi:hypothetical protein
LSIDSLPPRSPTASGTSLGYVRLLRHLFRTGKADIHEPPSEDNAARRRVAREVRDKIRSWRERRLSAGEIAQLLSDEGVELAQRLDGRGQRLNRPRLIADQILKRSAGDLLIEILPPPLSTFSRLVNGYP